jgi:tight adherence protein B
VGALHMLVQYSPTPLSQEFSVIEREVRLGVSLETAIQHLMVRMPCPGVHMLGAALMVAIQTGGQMADMLAETAASLLGEQHVQQKAAALMSQGWMQAWVMGGLPVGLVLILTSMDERFWVQITETGLGQSLLACLLLMECLGMWWLRRITKQVMSG